MTTMLIQKVCASWLRGAEVIVDMQVYASNRFNACCQSFVNAPGDRSKFRQANAIERFDRSRLIAQRIPFLLNTSQYEDRAILNFDFLYTETYKEDVGFIAEVVIEGHYTGALTDVTCKETIVIDYPDHVHPVSQPKGNG